MEEYIPRHAEERIRLALSDTRVVAVVGPRQSGKTTLVRKIADEEGRQYLSLDDLEIRRFAQEDPYGLLRDRKAVAIDEIQHAPELIMTIKRLVDESRISGQFLITGSVRLFESSISPDSLAGRVEKIELYPFSQAEIARWNVSRFLNRLFDGDFPSFEKVGRTNRLIERICLGGYPEALARHETSCERTWLRSYVEMLIDQDLPVLARVDKVDELTRLISLLAESSGRQINYSSFGSQLRIDSKTVERWLTQMEHLFLIKRIPAWHSSEGKRLVRSPKVQFEDSGLLSALRRIRVQNLLDDRQQLGMLLESFVFSEINKAASLSDDTIRISHYRERNQFEVDFVLERFPDEIVGIEVKARASVRLQDFTGLKRLRDLCGDRFKCGVVLHDGDEVLQTSPKMFAMPIKMLWEA